MYKHFIILSLLVLVLATIYANSQSTFSKERLESAVANYIKNQTNDDIEIEILQNLKDISFIEHNIKANFSHDFKNFKGLGKVYLDFYDGSKKVYSEQIRIKIYKYISIPISSKVISSGTSLSKSDFTLKRFDVTNYNENELVNSLDIVGKVTKNAIPKDTPFRTKDLGSDIIIKRGQNIYIIAQSGAVQIKTIGTALQNGSEGDFIRVKREGQGNVVLTGEVDASGAVVIKSARTSLR